jgi:hypothetical protein
MAQGIADGVAAVAGTEPELPRVFVFRTGMQDPQCRRGSLKFSRW